MWPGYALVLQYSYGSLTEPPSAPAVAPKALTKHSPKLTIKRKTLTNHSPKLFVLSHASQSPSAEQINLVTPQ